MATATTTVDSDPPLKLNSIPTVDLSLFSQPELYALSLCSDSVFDLRRCDDVIIPKIDRSVFNESAGSRKQTYSRLRLAPAAASSTNNTIHRRTSHLRPHMSAYNNNNNSISSSSSKDDPEQVENSQIISLLKGLFKSDPNYSDLVVPIEVEYNNPEPVVASPVSIGPVSVIGKRKRGRPRKDEIVVPREVKAAVKVNNMVKKEVMNNVDYNRDKEIVNTKGLVLDLVKLAELEDPYGPEITRRTLGMNTEDQLLGFLKGCNGQWGSRRKKKRVVDASDFGDVLPKGWRLSLSIKKKVGQVWLFCRRYISPCGRQFESCRDVSAYLLSILGPQNSDKTNNICNGIANEQALNLASGNQQAADFVLPEDKYKIDTAVRYSSSPVTSSPSNQQLQAMQIIGITMENQGEKFDCPNCAMNFNGKDDLMQHQSICLRRKRSKAGTSLTDGVILKDGKFECQFCHKTFIERRRYNGHIGAHVRYEGKSAETSAASIEGKDDCHYLPCEIPDGESMALTSILADSRVIAETCDVNSNNKLNTDFPSKYKTRSCIETFYADNLVTDLNFVAHDMQDLQVVGDGSVLPEESSDKPVRNCIASNDRVCITEEIPEVVATKSDLAVACATSLSNNDNTSRSESSGKTHVIDSVDNKTEKCFLESEASGGCVPSPLQKEQISGGVDKNGIAGSADNEVLNKDPVSEIGLLPSNTSGATDHTRIPGGKDFTCTVDDSTLDTNKVANGDISGLHNTLAGLDVDGVSDVKENSSSDGHSLVPQESGEFIEKENIILLSMKAETELKRSSLSNIVVPCGDENSHGGGKNSNTSSSSLPSTRDDSKVEISSSHCRSYTGSDAENVTGLEEDKNYESYMAISVCKEKVCTSESEENVVSPMVEEPKQQIDSENSFLPDCEPSCENNVAEASKGESAEMKLNEFQVLENNKPVLVDSNESGHSPSVMTISKDRNLEFCSLVPSGNEQTFDLQDDVTGIYDSAMEDCKDENSERGLLDHFCIAETSDDVFGNKFYSSPLADLKFDDDRDIGNHELSLAFGNPHGGLFADTTSVEQKRDLGSRSFVPSEIDQSFGVQTNLSMVNSSMVQDPKDGRDSMSDLFSLSCNSGTNTFGNNLSTTYSGGGWEGRKINDVGNSINKNYMVGFSPYQPAEHAMPSAMWRTGEGNALQNRLADPSHSLVQSPSCFRTFDILSDKADNGLFRLGENYNNGPGVNDFRPGRSEPVEFSFLTAHNSNSLQQNSKVFSYGTEMGQEFNSSFWLGKDVMMPNIAVNQVSSVCVWCSNAFQHDPGHSGIQAGVGSMCPTCSARIEQVNIL